ncbi:lactonase family protein [Novosphingobium flavum]|uniref:Lactonase family protein n=1 Tax=Novosphingobium flavum TaxID=1778672 RepID=A0A7X1FSH1_9SPHN|nr:beta-propeller fold lactonase family protein [Novosphingobium flavum]MBC2666128.1 lactonase family protein [Novosphingobium flavum]
MTEPTPDIAVYVSQHGARQISVYRLNGTTGTLEPVQDAPAGGMVMPLAVSPDRRFLYAALRDEGSFANVAFTIDQRTGRLTRLGQVPAAESITYIATDHTGRLLFSATNPHGGAPATLSYNLIGPDGWLQQPLRSFETPPKLHAVIPDPGNRFVLATSCNGESIVRYPLDAATGTIGPDPLPEVRMEVTSRRGPRHLRFEPGGRRLYVINEYDGTVTVYAYDAVNADLTEIQVIAATPPDFEIVDRRGRGPSAGAADLHFTPDGRWLYASVRGALVMAIFAVDPETGLLTAAGHFPVLSEPRGFAIEPLGRYMIVAADNVAKLVVYRIEPASGACEKVHEYATGEGPNWVECVRL